MADATEKAEHERIFKKFEANGDGEISAAKLEEALRNLARSQFQHTTSENIMLSIISHKDRDDQFCKVKKMLAKMLEASMVKSFGALARTCVSSSQKKKLACLSHDPYFL
ncbi:hypothetical protein Bca4012_011883 [Brassica carinata]